MTRSQLAKIRRALGPRRQSAAAWNDQRQRIRELTRGELDYAESIERLGKRRAEILKMILYERGKREGWKRRRYPAPQLEAHL